MARYRPVSLDIGARSLINRFAISFATYRVTHTRSSFEHRSRIIVLGLPINHFDHLSRCSVSHSMRFFHDIFLSTRKTKEGEGEIDKWFSRFFTLLVDAARNGETRREAYFETTSSRSIRFHVQNVPVQRTEDCVKGCAVGARQADSHEKQHHVRQTRRKELDIRNRDGRHDYSDVLFSIGSRRTWKKGEVKMAKVRCSSFDEAFCAPTPDPRHALCHVVLFYALKTTRRTVSFCPRLTTE